MSHFCSIVYLLILVYHCIKQIKMIYLFSLGTKQFPNFCDTQDSVCVYVCVCVCVCVRESACGWVGAYLCVISFCIYL